MWQFVGNVIVAVIALIGTVIGTQAGIKESARLTIYRIEQLEKKVDKTDELENKLIQLTEQMKVANHRLADLEKR